MSEIKKIRVMVRGRVQGVWFRGWAVEQASGLGLDGWVRNRHDGRVEAAMAGPAASVDEMIRRMGSGPPLARVEAVEVSEERGDLGPGFGQASTV